MPRTAPVPSYRRHKPSGQAVVTIRTAGGRKDVYLGPHGSPESKAEYRRLLAEIDAAGPAAAGPAPADLTVNELLVAFLYHAAGYYARPDGTPTSELGNFRLALRPVRQLYGHAPAKDFGPLALTAVRDRLAADGRCRAQVNAAVGRVRRVFKWAAGRELVPAAVWQALQAVPGLRAGRSAAADRPPVGPVPVADYLATLPHMPPTLRAMAEVQRHTGMRPQLVRELTPGQVDTSGAVWVYRPARHKTAHRGRRLAVYVGPKAQAVLAPWLAGKGPDDPVFTPRQAKRESLAARRAARKTRVPPSQADRSREGAVKRKPGDRWTDSAYASAVRRACDRAGVPRWHPNQLRHLFATEVRARFGIEAAQVLLGHAKADVTQIYAERDAGLAERVAAAVG